RGRWWCPRSGSNRHSFRNRILSPARLPIPPQGLRGESGLKHIRSLRQSTRPGIAPTAASASIARLISGEGGMAGRIRTGMAGWVFPDWRNGQFYPQGLKQKDELGWASRQVTAIEINSTFYQNQKPESFAAWAAQTPEDFVFTVKGHQKVTHIKRLKDVAEPLELFFKSIEALGKRL